MGTIKISLLDIPAVYINLPDQTVRRGLTESQLSAWGHTNYKRIDGRYSSNEEWYKRGQSDSYIAAKSEYQTPFIVFEDDIMLHNNLTEIEVPDDADAVYLGGCFSLIDGDKRYEAYETEIPSIARVKNMLSNHAIMYLSQDLVDEYKEELKKSEAADLIMQRLSEKYNLYAVQPVIFFQNDDREEKQLQNHWTRVINYITHDGFPAP